MSGIKRTQQKKTLTDILRASTKGMVAPVVVVLAKLGITPNALTVFGLVMHLPVAWALVNGAWRWAAFFGIFSVADVLDGSLARHLNKEATSKFGAFLDSTIDRIAEVLIFGGLVWWFSAETQPLFALLSLFALAGSLLVSYTRARAEALGFECKVGLFSRVERYLVLFVFGMLQRPDLCVIVLAVGTWITVVQRGWTVYQQATQA